jgi:hypothetical protein
LVTWIILEDYKSWISSLCSLLRYPLTSLCYAPGLKWNGVPLQPW